MLAPTGTIAFMMDCDTTGIEPDIALIKYKKLVGEGFLKIVNETVPQALLRLGYTPDEVESIVAYIDEFETIEGAVDLKPEHLSVFDCAFKPVNGERSIHHMGHLRMMSAAQPFLSGAISKTVNMPESATAEDIEDVYMQGWKLGLKAIAIYRDGSKRSQPLSTGKKKEAAAEANTPTAGDATGFELTGEPKPYRRRLPDERRAVTHKYQVAGHEGYITVGLYPDGQPGEIFLKMAKEGSTVSGLMDTLATMTSIALQYGVPLRDLVNKFTHVRFEPSGFTGNPRYPSPSRSSTTSSAGWDRGSSPRTIATLSASWAARSSQSHRRRRHHSWLHSARQTARPIPPRPRPRPLLRPPPEERAGTGLAPRATRSRPAMPGPARMATVREPPWLRSARASASPSRSVPTHPLAWTAAASWFATARATSASTVAPRAAAADRRPSRHTQKPRADHGASGYPEANRCATSVAVLTEATCRAEVRYDMTMLAGAPRDALGPSSPGRFHLVLREWEAATKGYLGRRPGGAE